MKLNTLAKLALIGLFYTYIIKLIDTLHHGVFGSVAFFKRALIAGVTGWSVMVLAHSLVLINFLHAGRLVLMADLRVIGPFIFIMTSTVTLVCLLIFFKIFSGTNSQIQLT